MSLEVWRRFIGVGPGGISPFSSGESGLRSRFPSSGVDEVEVKVEVEEVDVDATIGVETGTVNEGLGAYDNIDVDD